MLLFSFNSYISSFNILTYSASFPCPAVELVTFFFESVPYVVVTDLTGRFDIFVLEVVIVVLGRTYFVTEGAEPLTAEGFAILSPPII